MAIPISMHWLWHLLINGIGSTQFFLSTLSLGTLPPKGFMPLSLVVERAKPVCPGQRHSKPPAVVYFMVLIISAAMPILVSSPWSSTEFWSLLDLCPLPEPLND